MLVACLCVFFLLSKPIGGIEVQTSASVILLGDDITLSCPSLEVRWDFYRRETILGQDPVLVYNGRNVIADLEDQYAVSETNGTNFLTISEITMKEAGEYRCSDTKTDQVVSERAAIVVAPSCKLVNSKESGNDDVIVSCCASYYGHFGIQAHFRCSSTTERTGLNISKTATGGFVKEIFQLNVASILEATRIECSLKISTEERVNFVDESAEKFSWIAHANITDRLSVQLVANKLICLTNNGHSRIRLLNVGLQSSYGPIIDICVIEQHVLENGSTQFQCFAWHDGILEISSKFLLSGDDRQANCGSGRVFGATGSFITFSVGVLSVIGGIVAVAVVRKVLRRTGKNESHPDQMPESVFVENEAYTQHYDVIQQNEVDSCSSAEVDPDLNAITSDPSRSQSVVDIAGVVADEIHVMLDNAAHNQELEVSRSSADEYNQLDGRTLEPPESRLPKVYVTLKEAGVEKNADQQV